MQVYAILIHQFTNPLAFTVQNLLKSINSIVIVHIDSKTNFENVKEIKNKLGNHENLYYIDDKDRINVRWGHFSQIEAILTLMEYASKFEYQYFNLISGDDIPLSSNSSREIFLEESYKNGIQYIACEVNENYQNRIKIKYPRSFFKKKKTLRNKIFNEISLPFLKIFSRQSTEHLPKLYFGAQWFTITDEAVKYIMTYCENNPSFLNAFKKSLCGDEIFFQTILANSSFKKNIYLLNNNCDLSQKAMRYIDWHSGPDYPKTLNANDFDKMLQSNMLFARKLNKDINFEALRNLVFE